MALTFPLAPFLSHAAGEKGGRPSPSPRPPSSPTLRERKGEDARSRGDPAPASFNDTEATTQITPLPQCGSGAGGEGGPHLPPSPLPLPRCGRGRGRWDSYGCNTIYDQPGASGTATAEIIEDDLPDAHAFDALAESSAGAQHTGVEAPPRGAVVPLRLDTRRSDADRLFIPVLSVTTGYQTSLLSLGLTGCFDPFRTLSARHSDQGANLSLLSLLES